jgi:hypothetical protein
MTESCAGLEVKPGTTLKCVPEDDYILHLSQVCAYHRSPLSP